MAERLNSPETPSTLMRRATRVLVDLRIVSFVKSAAADYLACGWPVGVDEQWQRQASDGSCTLGRTEFLRCFRGRSIAMHVSLMSCTSGEPSAGWTMRSFAAEGRAARCPAGDPGLSRSLRRPACASCDSNTALATGRSAVWLHVCATLRGGN